MKNEFLNVKGLSEELAIILDGIYCAEMERTEDGVLLCFETGEVFRITVTKEN